MNETGTKPQISPAPAATASSAYKWWVVFMLWFVCFFNYADRQSISSVFPLLQKDFKFDKFQLGLIGSVFAWVYAGFALVAGLCADRFSRKKLAAVGCAARALVHLFVGVCLMLKRFDKSSLTSEHPGTSGGGRSSSSRLTARGGDCSSAIKRTWIQKE